MGSLPPPAAEREALEREVIDVCNRINAWPGLSLPALSVLDLYRRDCLSALPLIPGHDARLAWLHGRKQRLVESLAALVDGYLHAMDGPS